MAFGILEDHKLDSVPGTGLLSAKANRVTIDEARELKRGTGKYSHIVLIPQPSDDPRDPAFTMGLASVLSPLASPAYVLLAKEFKVSVDEVASSFGATVPGVAVFMLVQNTLAVKYGHRIVYLLSTFLMFVSCVWTALSSDLVSIRASRVFQGFGEAAPQCLIAATLEHLYLGPLINSYVIQNRSWQLGFWFVSIACGLCFIGVFFFVPETTYHRQESSSHDSRPIKHEIIAVDKDNIEKMPRTSAMSDVSDAEIRKVNPNAPSPNPPTFLSQLRIYNGTFSDESVRKIFLRPFPFLLSPVTWFVFLSFSMPMVWTNLVSLCSSTIFTVTYCFNVTQIAQTNLGGIVGIALAMIVTGPINDRLIVWMSQRNRGVYEPEYRTHLHGVKRSLLVLGACQAVCWLASVPMYYVYGKRVRSFIARHHSLFRGDLPASDFPQFAVPT
ncbi:major facilitator superfamily domain-containing protein [Ganoderma leucocontextum]|nr:major facilitator superfamily domain-containing protein [Ganoderma leucocontextum]